MANQDNKRLSSMSRRTLMKMAGATVAGGYLGTNLLRGETLAAEGKELIKPVSGKQASVKYPLLLSPVKIGKHVLKNRMIALASSAHTLLGPHAYPNEAIMHHYANVARRGASLIITSQGIGVHPENNLDILAIREKDPNHVTKDHGTDSGHYPDYDLADGGCQNMLSQLTEAVHFYGSKILMKLRLRAPAGYDASPGNPTESMYTYDANGNWDTLVVGGPDTQKKEITKELMQQFIDQTVLECVLAKEVGYDGFYMHMAYRGPLTARFLSPLTNRRKDEYGGSVENRARFCVEIMKSVKERCGEDFLIMGTISGHEPEGGYTLDDAAEYAKMFTPYMDMLSLKGDPGLRDSAPTYFFKEKTPFLYMTEHLKKKGVTLPLVTDGGFLDPDHSEETLAGGKADIIGMARAWLTTPDYGRLVFEGRNEDIVPCIRCNRCHNQGLFKPFNSICTVNPDWGLQHKLHRMISPPDTKKKVAVIGGGPAGMEAAMVAARRGHDVTLYEKSGRLGGNLGRLEDVSFKWPHRDFKNYLVRQVEKLGVKILLNTEATAAMIRKTGYDSVIAAVGAELTMPDIPGIKGSNVALVTDMYGKEKSLSKDVVIIGGGQTGVEAGIHLAENGHNVTVLEKAHMLAPDAVHVHYYSALKHYWEQIPTFHFVVNATCNGVTSNGATYVDADGKEHSIKAGSMVLAAGLTSLTDLALTFHAPEIEFHMVGDCEKVDDLTHATRTAFSAASLV